MTDERMTALRADPVIVKLSAWGEAREEVRAAILTSTRAAAGRPTDDFSDYDVIDVVRDAHDVRALLDDGWLSDFGEILNLYRDPVQERFGHERFIRVTQYADGLKIDFSVYPAGWLEEVKKLPQLPPVLDVGYAVLLDKDGVTKGLPPFTRTAYLPARPTEAEFQEAVLNFFSNAAYVAKHLRRDELVPLMEMQHVLRAGRLRQMLEWRVAIESGWSVPNGAYGRGLDERLDAATLEELRALYTGPGKAENWESLFRTVALYERLTREVAEALGFAFPAELFRRNVAYLQRVRARPS